MNAKHLHAQAGGDPAQGPHPDVANPAPSPSAGNEFPDHPEESVASHPQDQPDLDAFAERLGTDRLDDRSPAWSEDTLRGWRRPVSRALEVLAAGARSIGDRLGAVSDKLAPDDEHRTRR
jgi:hypothetical protein